MILLSVVCSFAECAWCLLVNVAKPYRNINTARSRVHGTVTILKLDFNLPYVCFRITVMSWNVRKDSYTVAISAVHALRHNYHRLEVLGASLRHKLGF